MAIWTRLKDCVEICFVLNNQGARVGFGFSRLVAWVWIYYAVGSCMVVAMMWIKERLVFAAGLQSQGALQVVSSVS